MKNPCTFHNSILKAFCIIISLVFLVSKSNAQSVSITSPSSGASFVAGTSITVTTTNSDFGIFKVTSMVFTLGSLSQTDNSGPSFTTTFNTSTLAAGSYTLKVTANNVFGAAASTSIPITITSPLSVAVAGNPGCGAGSVVFTASGGTPANGTYNWYNTTTGGSIATGATYAPIVTGTYYVSYTSGSTTSSRVPVTATINPVVSSPLSGAMLSYPLNGNANDVSGNSDNGTLQGNPTLTTDRYGNANSAYTFNGTSQYISSATQFDDVTTFSLSVWFKTTTTSGGKLIGWGASQTGQSSQFDRHIYMSNSGQLYFGLYNNGALTINTANSYNDGTWHHVIVTVGSADGSRLYVDGALQVSSTAMNTPENSNGYWRIGYDNLSGWNAAPSSNFFAGQLDDISVYNRELSAAEVAGANNLNLIGATAIVCAGSPITLNAPTITGATYAWQDAAGNTATGQNPTFASAVAGNYTLTVTGGPGNCTSQATITPTMNAAPSAAFTATSSVSTGGNATVTYTGTDPSSSTFSWNFNGGSPSTETGKGPFSVSWSSSGTKTITLTVTNANGCTATSTQTVTVGFSTYAFSDNVTLNTTSLGISSNLTNFPALLSIQDNNLIISGACTDKVYYPNGPNYDFAFYDPVTAAELSYQVESYNQTTGTLLVWVKIPTLTFAANKSITFYYGSKTLVAAHNTAFYENTWASDYKAVFHFNESGYTGSVTDGTAGGHTGTTVGMSSGNLVAGKIGNAYLFGGASNITSNAVNITGAFTISAWINLSVLNTDQKVMTNQAEGGSSTGGYKLGVYSDNTAESESGTAINRSSTPTPAPLAAGVWHYVQSVFTGSTLSTYIDGAQYKNLNTTTAPTSTTPFYIGAGEGGDQYYFNGIIDEARVSNVAKTTDWIKAEYVDQNNPAAFTIVGSPITNITNAVTIPGALTYTWTGLSGTNLTDAANWTNLTAGILGQLPAFDGSASLVIPAGLINYPKLTANSSLYGLTIASGASINLNGFTLSVGCNIYNSSGGQILYGSNNTSGIIWNGSLPNQTYTGTGTTNTAALGSMTINNSAGGTVTISGGPVDIYNALTLTNGNLVVSASPAVLTLKSTATQTASVAAIPAGSTITGIINVERYLTGGVGYRGYRLMSSPVYAGTANSNNVYSINYLQNNVILTGSAGGGFDKTGNPTIYLFREDQIPSNTSFTGGNFWGISAINNTPSYNYYVNGGPAIYNLPVGSGYMFFFRGDRSVASIATETTSTYTPQPVAVTTSGTLNQGQVTVHDWYTPTSANLGFTGTGTGTNFAVRGFNLVGNPYASSIDWNQYNTTSSTTGIYAPGVSNVVYELNPLTYNYDTYQTGPTPTHTNKGSNIIASGQGFFVLASGNTAQLIFNETAKTASENTGTGLFMYARASLPGISTANIDQHLRLQLALDSINTDDIYIGFNADAKAQYVFNEDAPYKPGTGQLSLTSISSDSVTLAINRLPLPKVQSLVIPLTISGTTDGIYKLNRTEFEAIPQLYEVWLMDAYKKDSLDLRNNATYAFNLYPSDANSYGSSRFSLVIRQNPALGVHLLSFAATKAINGAQVTWTTENEENYTNFAVERSTDGGATFSTLGGFVSSSLGAYNFVDTDPLKAADEYRLKLIDLNGTVSYSKIATLMYGNTNSAFANSAISIYPNPAKGALNLTILSAVSSNSAAGQSVSAPAVTNTANNIYGIKILSNTGLIVKTATTTDAAWQTDVSNLVPGTYIIQVVNDNNKSVIGQSTFIKL